MMIEEKKDEKKKKFSETRQVQTGPVNFSGSRQEKSSVNPGKFRQVQTRSVNPPAIARRNVFWNRCFFIETEAVS